MSTIDDLNFDDVDYDVSNPAWKDPAFRRQMQSSPNRPMVNGIPVDIATDPDLQFGPGTLPLTDPRYSPKQPKVEALTFDDVEPERTDIGVMDFLRNPIGSAATLVQEQMGRNFASDDVERTWGEALVTDPATQLRRGTRNVVGGLAGLPVDALNTADLLNPVGLANRIAGGAAPIEQPDAVRGVQEALQVQNERDLARYGSERLQAQVAESQGQDTFADMAGFLAQNPSAAASEFIAQIPQLLPIIRGSKWGTVALQSMLAGSQNASQVYQDLVAAGAEPGEAERLAANVAAVSSGSNAAFTALPGAAGLERVASSGVGRAGGDVATTLLGEIGSEAGQEGTDQIIQNVATGRPWDEGAGAAAALGAAVGAPGGAIAAGADVLADRAAPAAPAAPEAPPGAPLADNPLAAAIAEALRPQTAQEAPQGPTATSAPTPAPEAGAPSPGQPAQAAADPAATVVNAVRDALAGVVPAGVPSTPTTGDPDAQATASQAAQGEAADQQVRTALDEAEAGARPSSEASRAIGEAQGEVDPLAPRAPAPAQVPDTLTLERARAEHDQARTDDERAAAAARIAAVQARERAIGEGQPDQGPSVGAPDAASARANHVHDGGFEPSARAPEKPAADTVPADRGRDRGDGLGSDPAAAEAGDGNDRDVGPRLRNAPGGLTDRYTDTDDADIRAALGPAARGVTVARTPADLDPADRERLGFTDADMDVEGVYDPDTGRSFVFAENLQPTMRELGLTEAQAKVWVAGHERSGHAGLRGMTGDARQLGIVLDRARSNPTVAALTKVMGQGRPERGQILIEEALAELSAAYVSRDYATLERKYGVQIPAAQRATLEGYIRRLFDAIRAAFGKAGEGMSDSAIYQLVRDANRYARRGEVRGTSRRAREQRPVAQRAFHGSPHKGIERFSLQKIGTGEGNQVFGWGLYFAGNREVGDQYRRALSSVGRRGGKIADMLLQRVGGDRRRAIEDLNRIRRMGPAAASRFTGVTMDDTRVQRDFLNDAEAFIRAESNRGQLYETDVPEDNELLDWDAPLSEQPEKVRAAIMSLPGDAPKDEFLTGRQIYSLLATRPGVDYGAGDGQMEASQALNAAGIPGLRYADGGSRARTEGRTYNYVIWDESRIGPAQGLIASRAVNRKREIESLDGDSFTTPEESTPFSRRLTVNPYGEDAGTDLEGMPNRIRVGDKVYEFHGYLPAQEIAAKYAARHGNTPPTTYARVDEERARRIAEAYEDMPHAPDDPEVKRAYDAMIKETLQQYRDILKTGLKLEFIDGEDPYADSPRRAILDVVENNHLWVFPTDNGFGSSAFDVTENPLLSETEFEISGRKALANDIFRAVHDYFGHIANGVGFRADGEENAWREHSAMYSPLARRAMTSETRGQNSWVNFGPYGERNRTASAIETTYADQKTGLMPEWVSEDGRTDGPVASRAPRNPVVDTPAFKRWFGDSKVVDENGDPLVVYHGARRPDRINDRFRAARATSGPMAFFTTDPGVASGYAQGKQDTSLDEPASYAEWFQYKPSGARTRTIPIDRMWYDLTPEQRREIADKLPRVSNTTPDGDEMDGYRLGEPGEFGLSSGDHWQHTIRETRGDVIAAAVELWLNGGVLYGNESDFMEVLRLGGVPLDRLTYANPNAGSPAIFPVYLRISNPFDTANTGSILPQLRNAAKRRRGRQYGVDLWDKRAISGPEWIRAVEEDVENGTDHAWTTIPDWVTDTLRSMGHDGIRDRGGKHTDNQHTVWIPFSDRQVKSATGNAGTFDDSPSIIASRPVFYSAALQSIEDARGAPKKGDANTWAGWLDGAVRRGEMKQGERDWLGIDEWIKENEPVTREQLAEFVRANQVQIEETTLGGDNESDFDPDNIDLFVNDESTDSEGMTVYDVEERSTGDQFIISVDEDAGNVYVQGVGGVFLDIHAPMNQQSYSDAEFAIREHLIEKYAPKGAEGTDGPTRYSEYTMPGGENYREILLRIPSNTGGFQFKWDGYAHGGRIFATREEAQAELDRQAAAGNSLANEIRIVPANNGGFASNHFDESNILAHARFNERTDADGSRVLFVEEIQSDWHQAGRKRGYGKQPRLTDDEVRAQYPSFTPEEWSAMPAGEFEAMRETAQAAVEHVSRGKRVPDAPLKATDEWAMLAFKRIARWAVDNGFAKIAWTTGAQQADRYDLAKRVRNIEYFDDNRLFVHGVNGSLIYNEITPEKDLPDVIGKEAADRLLAQPAHRDSTIGRMGATKRTLAGEGLKIGGEGMVAFYDKILPKAVNKWAKKFGARVSSSARGAWYGYDARNTLRGPFDSAKEAVDEGFGNNLFEKNGATDWHSIEVTDAMREAVREGQPLFSRRTPAQARAERQQLLGQLNTAGFPGGPAIPPPPGGKLATAKSAADWMRARLQDRMIEVLRAQERTGARNAPGITSITLQDNENAYRLETLLHGSVRDILEGGEHDFLRPIQGRLKNLKMSVATFEGYLLARAAKEINEQVAKVNPAMPDGGSGMTTDEAAAMLAGTGPNPYTGKVMSQQELQQAKSIAVLVDGLRDATLANMVAGHQITQELADSLKETYPNYIPTRGKDIQEWMDVFGGGTGRGLSGKRAPIKRRLGRGAGNLPRDILGEMAGDFQKSAVARGKAKVNQAFLRFAMANPMPDLYEVEPVDLEWKFSKATGEAYLGVKASTDDGNTSIIVMHEGSPVRIRFNDRGIRDAMLAMGPDDVQGVVKILGAVNRWRSQVLTQYNPAFAPVNMGRDAIFGLTALTSEHGVAVAAEAAAYYVPAMRAMYRQNTSRPGDASVPVGQRSMDDFAREASAAGMKTGLTRVDDVKDLQRRMSMGATTLMQLAAEGRPWSLARESVTRALGPIVQTISNANDATENALRLSAYAALRRRGMSVDRAAEYAKNMTINFNRKGQWGPALNALYLFYNASIQGTHAVARVLSNPKVAGALVALGALQGLLLRQMMDDDDNDGVTPLDTIPDYVKRTSFIVPLGWATGNELDYFAIPMPYGFNVFTYAGGRVSQWMELGARETDASVGADIAKSMVESFSPVPINGDYGSLYGDQLGFAMQLMANRDDEGRPISNLNTHASYDIPLAIQGRATTPAVYERTAQLMAKVGGGDLTNRIPPVGYLDVSPEQIETVVNYFGGGLTRMVNQGMRWAETFNAGNFDDAMEMVSKTPIASRFVGRGNEGRAIADHYYGERGEFDRRVDVLQDRLQGMGDDEVPRAIREFGAQEVDLRGLRADRYKSKKRKGEIKRSGSKVAGRGRVRLARGEGSTASALKGAESAVRDLSMQINRLRDDEITVQDVVDIGRDNDLTIEQIGLPANYNGAAVAPNRIRQRAIKLLQEARTERQRGALQAITANRRAALSPEDYMRYWDGQ